LTFACTSSQTWDGVNSIPELELMVNSGIGIDNFGIGIDYFGIGIEVCYKKIHKLTITIYIYCFIYFIELSKEEHLKYTCMEYIIHNNIISI
jgi:hypothetical protein